MKKKLLVYGLLVLVLLVVGYVVIYGFPTSEKTDYQYGDVTRGDIETTVSATGTLSPVTTVQVGTQVSGTIDSVYVDFNDHVHEGQVMAVLDTVLLKASVLDADANVEKAQAQLDEAQFEDTRNKALYDRSLISESDYLPFKVGLKTAESAVKSALAAKQRADRNLQYAVIKAPISGVVISRNIEAGQTVAASLSTPTLFVIAEDLSHMEILADVDESDIGQIKVGQDVRFEVASYAEREFTGTVKQIRLQPQTISNVVTYTAVIQAGNPDGLLLPGMTATIDFITEKHTDALLVPSKALRFTPTEQQLAAYRARQAKNRPSGEPQAATPPNHHEGFNRSNRNANFGMVWYTDSTGQLEAARVHTGLSDGTNTEITSSHGLTDGMKVIVAEVGPNSGESELANGERPGGFHGRGFRF